MIYYGLNDSSRAKTYFFLAIASVLLIFLIEEFIKIAMGSSNIGFWSNFTGYIKVPTTLTIFGLVVFLYDNFIWKFPIFRTLHKIPIVDGTWKGTLERSSNPKGSNDLKEITVDIKQTWSKFSFVLSTPNTRSKCMSASLSVTDPHPEFLLMYKWEPTNLKDPDMFGEGAQKLILSKSANQISLCGPYYSTRGNAGELKLTKAI